MSERILRALMQLFAIIAKVDEVPENDSESVEIQSTKGKEIIRSFLKTELSSADVNKYLSIFDDFLISTRGRIYSKKKDQKRTSLHSVKILRICSQVNTELTQRQKIIVLIRILEFIHRDDFTTGNELKFVQTVSDTFNVSQKEFETLVAFVNSNGKEIVDETGHIYYCSKDLGSLKLAKSGFVDGLDSPIHFVNIESVKTIFFRYHGKDELYINGKYVVGDKVHVLNVGSTLRTGKSTQIFYSDLISKLSSAEEHEQISFKALNIEHSFKSGKPALREISIQSTQAKMIGVMGGSGSGKTTLLNILNGKIKPTSGKVEINGIDLHSNQQLLEGVVGNVNQDDLLIEELSVFENLFFSAKLSMGHLTSNQIAKKTVEVLKSIGLYEIRYLKVGSPLDKVISGGQRKRLNIALELIREPSILFVDEPTSGLSSRDSDNIMDLLKELSLKGKLVFVVIHQPSSNIFKLFDRLIIMDQGGFPVYDGIPLNAIVHFKTHSYKGNAHERECNLCGNVNPEQIFNLIDAKIVDEFGVESESRKRGPKDWNILYLDNTSEQKVETINSVPKKQNTLPSKFSQFISYVKRDFLSKIANRQYVLMNALVAPILAVLLSYFIKYSGWVKGEMTYSYYLNENIPQYIFISVIVSIFLGLTVAAEEINKDKKILEREAFIHLSRSSYLLSKVWILIVISAIQSLLFVLIGNTILDIREMYFEYWFMLFSTACFSNIVGLNISSAFNSAKVIYIMVPLMIIPQLLFSGVIVKFDKLHPSLSNATKVPWLGNMMVSRWAYEGLVVEQSSSNNFENYFFDVNATINKAEWVKDYWIPEMNSLKRQLIDTSSSDVQIANARETLINEIKTEEAKWTNLECELCVETIASDKQLSEEQFKAFDKFINYIRLQSIKDINESTAIEQAIIDSLGVKEYKYLKDNFQNEALVKMVTNKLESNKLINYNGRLYQNATPIYNTSNTHRFFDSPFYAPGKVIFGSNYKTYSANLIVIWIFSILTYIALYFDILRKGLVFSMKLMKRLNIKKASS
jgi:ABC transport system ATP-binding/permease protein